MPRLRYRLLTLCPAPADPVGHSWPRGTGSVGDSVGEGYYSVIHIAVLLQCETPSWCLRCRECSWPRQGNYTHASTDAPASGVSAVSLPQKLSKAGNMLGALSSDTL